ncbi:MAG: tetratricopeptide repeat protein [Thermodesulfobacteriota bacterium]
MPAKQPKDMVFLIVDDVDNMRRSIKAMLKLLSYGREYYEAPNGRDAWKLMQDQNLAFDFVISDYYMPHMSGTELLNLVRSNKKTRDIPFLMITAEANMDVVAEAAEHDVDAYMTKPFVTATLEQKINELLNHQNNPDQVTRHLLNARDMDEQGNLPGAIAEATKATALNPRSSRPYRELGRLLLKKGDIKNGQICFEKAIELNRLDVSSYHALGQIYFRLNQVEKAMQFFSRAMEISPRHSDRALNFAKLLLKKNRIPEAEKILRMVIKSKANDIDLREEVADACAQHNLCDLAVKTYQDVLKDDPERFYLSKKIGLTLLKGGERNEGLKALEKVAEKFPEDIDVLLTLAKTYFEMRMTARADWWAGKLLRVDPQHEEAREIARNCV